MITCKKCLRQYDETIAAGICPYCGCENTEALPVQAAKKPSDPRWLRAGTVLHGRYEVVQVIGAGGFGITYKVIDRYSGVFKAVKEYFQQGVVNRIPGTAEVLISAPKRREEFEYGRSRLLAEARIVAKFQSESIVRVEDYFEENNTSYMVMEFLDGQTLEDYIVSRKRPLSPEQAVQFGAHICDALQEIHEAGVIHRDLAPDNIFVNEDGSVKIIDFGSARLSREDFDDRLIVLKPGFAPPEQYERIDPRNDRQQAWTDVYALGATLYMALTGQVPAEASDRKADFDNHCDRVRYPQEINPQIPDFLNNTIMTAMAINIHERFQSAGEFKDALLGQRQVLPVEVVRKRKVRRRTFGIAGSLVAAVLLVLIGFQWFGNRRDQAVLAPAEVSVWYALEADDDQAARKNAAMEAIVGELEKSDRFSKETITLQGIPEDSYPETLAQAYRGGEMPVLYESLLADAPYLEGANSLLDVAARVQSECPYLDGYTADCRFPVGFDAPVVYINSSLVTDIPEGTTVDSVEAFMKLSGGSMAYLPVAADPDVRALLSEALPDYTANRSALEAYTAQDFLEGRAVAYFADTSDYFRVRSALPGHFVMLPVKAEPSVLRYSNFWSTTTPDGDTREAAQEILAYLLSNYAQDQLYLQAGCPGLPLEKTALDNYVSVRHAFQPVFGSISNPHFCK